MCVACCQFSRRHFIALAAASVAASGGIGTRLAFAAAATTSVDDGRVEFLT
jgi:hypothetical protein